ncbi:MAG: hypothetical protein JWP07_4075, partial [Pseudonocardiales bacterium]|nr:hypothetical protein [Pseudonocardiales bacterium]
ALCTLGKPCVSTLQAETEPRWAQSRAENPHYVRSRRRQGGAMRRRSRSSIRRSAMSLGTVGQPHAPSGERKLHHRPEDRRHAVLARRCDLSRRIRHQCYGGAPLSPRDVRAAQRGRAQHATRRRRTKERLEDHAEAGPGGRIEVLEPHKVHCRATNWRCQRSSVAGDTIRTCKSLRGSSRGLLMETAGNTVSEIDPRVRGSRPDVWCGAWRRTH